MRFYSRKNRRAIAVILTGWIALLSLSGVFAFRVPAHAQQSLGAQMEAALGTSVGLTCTGLVPCPVYGQYLAWQAVNREEIKPGIGVAMISILLNLMTFVLDRVAYEAAVYVATGGQGETPLFFGKTTEEAWKQLGLDVAGEAIGLLRDDVLKGQLEIDFDICAPSDLINLAFALGIKQAYTPQKPRCDFREVQKNWDAYVTRTIDTLEDPKAAILSTFAAGLRPGQNELSAGITINLKVQEKVLLSKQTNLMDKLANSGFKDVTDFITGDIKTPASLLKDQVDFSLKASKTFGTEASINSIIFNPELGLQLLAHSTSIFTNTLLSTLVQRIYQGLFPTQPFADPFNLEVSVTPGRKNAQQSFSGLISSNPIVTTPYNALGEFVVCPFGANATRNVNNCVMESNFAAAVSRAATDRPLTVQEAIDEGLLYGDWPLISPTDQSANQDPLCYSRGYCYGNLVKLRKARILPVGWELAAMKNAVGNPATLQEIVGGFDSCNERGAIDPNHPWCHLIDPNWVLKYPETQCRAFVNGEILSGAGGGARATVCADTPSCVSENNDGTCTGSYGYCVRERNTWHFRGEECPVEFASCLAFNNTFTGEAGNWLLNTVDFSVCNADNAGCRWYRTNQYLDDKGTADTADDSYEWLPVGDAYVVQDWDAAIQSQSSVRSSVTEGLYAYEDRVYFNNNVEQCSAAEAGCSQLYPARGGLRLNLVANPSFEDDANDDDVPDFWQPRSAAAIGDYETAGTAFHGSDAILIGTGADTALDQRNIALASNSFYTLSAYIQGNAAGAGGSVFIEMTDAEGASVNLNGTSFDGGCVPRLNGDQRVGYTLAPEALSTAAFQRLTCTFTSSSEPSFAFIAVVGQNVRFDAVQLELGENISDFTTGYSSASPQTAYLRVPPDYFGCTGAPTDPPECDAYTQVCSAQDVGCNRYTPEGGNPAIPAVVSDLDRCPVECVGYSAFKQEATRYEQEKFPLYFIADRAAACQQQFVGCDSFTNLDTVATGGEGIEYYTNLRACLKPTDAGSQAQTYFTWEGSDASGYQLVTWQLLESNLNPGTTIEYTQAPPPVPPSDEFAPLAPCTKWRMNSASVLVCEDDDIALAGVDDCNEHSDIFTNPDCREFYDSAGHIHYRKFSDTVTVSDECHPYRKTESTRVDCQATGGFWSAAGECRYFGLAGESVACPAAANGCREYTGGAGRNASTIASLDFENGTAADVSTTGALNSVVISNESVATDGHSLRVEAAAAGGGIYGSVGELMVPGKTFVFDFWAKGSGPIHVALVEGEPNGAVVHDFVNPLNPAGTVSDLALTGGWQPYTLGPLDTSKPGFTITDDTILRVTSANGATVFFLDNIRLKQTEENVTIIKDSWVVPATCDASPTGVAAPQYFLGCEAYTDQNGTDASLYQFSRLCSDAVVGCEAFYDTQNSSSPYAQAFNLRCERLAGNTIQNTACTIAGTTYCSIGVGRSSCLFDMPAAIPSPLPVDANFRIVLGPEAVVVSNDTTAYLVDDGSTTCSAASMGCEEVGVPTYNQDKSRVASFESAYTFNLPDNYSDILCSNEALFCEEWSSTKDGNFYFKDPIKKACEFKTNVSLGGRSYSGWFRAGINEPCYWTNIGGDAPGEPVDFDFGIDQAYLLGGDSYGVYRNGDPSYQGWAGACTQSYDLCTEFLDPTDTQEGKQTFGTPYYFLNNDELSNANIQDVQPCSGQVSQKLGCALFNNKSNLELTASAGPTYVASTHADLLFGEDRFSLQDPINCDVPEGGVIRQPNGTTVDLCRQRCEYNVGSNNDLVGVSAVPWSVDPSNSNENSWATEFVGSCLTASDCPVLTAKNARQYVGTCKTLGEAPADPVLRARFDRLVFHNDTNTVMKVNRDRECAQWLACSRSQMSWNERTSKWEQICDSIGLCSESGKAGERSTCSAGVQSEPIPLTAERYAQRDVSWQGLEYDGYTVPAQIPIEHLSQININPGRWCVNEVTGETRFDSVTGLPVECSVDDSCGSGNVCEDAVEQDVRLAYEAGPCEENNGEACTVGFCDQGGNPCANNTDCGTGDRCVFGYCQYVTPTSCTSSAECEDVTVNGQQTFCDTTQNRCIIDTSSVCGPSTGCAAAGGATSVCSRSDRVKDGTCFNSQCLNSVGGAPFVPQRSEALVCRGYPEATAPFPSEIVKDWVATTAEGGRGTPVKQEENLKTLKQWSTPYDFRSGFQSTNTCAPVDCDENGENCKSTDECLCSYDKVEYGDGAGVKYYANGTEDESLLPGLCVGGEKDGFHCESNVGCRTDGNTAGTCQNVTRRNSLLGWEGYCLERDTSIQLYGNPSPETRPCLTWLPVDQTIGATDLYAKYTSAGFTMERDSYYCAEAAYYADLYVTGAVIEDGVVVDVAVARADSEAEFAVDSFTGSLVNSKNCLTTGHPKGSLDVYGEYLDSDGSLRSESGCESNIVCPNGYIGALGACRNDFPGNADDDSCPYICIPKGSTHIEGPDAGISCLKDYLNEDGSYHDVLMGGANIGNTEYIHTEWAAGEGDSAYIAKHFFPGEEIAGGQSVLDFYKDCVVRGVPIRSSQYAFFNASGISSTTSSGNAYGYSGLYHGIDPGSGIVGFGVAGAVKDVNNIQEYLGCLEVVKVAAEFKDVNLRNKFANKAWTNRLWEAYQGLAHGIPFLTFQGGSLASYLDFSDGVPPKALDYQAQTSPTLAGRALFDEYFPPIRSRGDDVRTLKGWEADSWPLPVLSCQEGSSQVVVVLSCSNNPSVNCTTDAECSQLPQNTCIVRPKVCNGEWNQDRRIVPCDSDSDCPDFCDVGPLGMCTEGRAADGGMIACDPGVSPTCGLMPGEIATCSIENTITLNPTGGLGLTTTASSFSCSPNTYPTDAQYLNVEVDDKGGEPWALAIAYEDLDLEDEAAAFGGQNGDNPSRFGNSNDNNRSSIQTMMSQFFAKVFQTQIWRWEWDRADEGRHGAYVKVTEGAERADYDNSANGDEFGFDRQNQFPNTGDRAPKVLAVGDCIGTLCFEGPEGKFNVNGVSEGYIQGGGGRQNASVSFFTYANPNQLPIRNINVDWGDGKFMLSDMNWPINPPSGSPAPNNFYKNHRGLLPNETPICATNKDWGTQPTTCDSSYITFNHDYTCSEAMVNNLVAQGRDCEEVVDADGTRRLLNSPCTGGDVRDAEDKCVFQPRVHVIDNWGWCTGFCTAGFFDNTNECYQDDVNNYKECNISACPSEGLVQGSECPDRRGLIDNPWINFDGFVVVDWSLEE